MPDQPIELTDEHRRFAAEIVLEHAREIERSTVREALYEHGLHMDSALVTAIHRAAVTATVTVDIEARRPEGDTTDDR